MLVQTVNEAILSALNFLFAPKALEMHDNPPTMKITPKAPRTINAGVESDTAATCNGSFV